MPGCLRLKKSNCKNCYKCIRHCPVKSIRFSAGQAHIIDDECILCGHCFVVCPQNAKEIVDDTEKVRVLLSGDDPVVVSLAPSFIANYDGVGIEAMRDALKKLGFTDVEDIERGRIEHCFIEMSACAGSCVGGPVMEKYHRSPVKDYIAVADFAGSRDFEVPQPDAAHMKQVFTPIENRSDVPGEDEIRKILREMGKFKPEHELNCGSCGYNTCRDKAIAIYQGKAEISMCLPFLKEKAEDFSDTIVRNSPNALIVVNDDLEVQQLNAAALRLMNLRYPSDILGDQVVRILDPGVFMAVRDKKRGVYDQRV